MCGIAGILSATPYLGGGARIGAARHAMAHRGPDDWGVLAHGPGGTRAMRQVPGDAEAHSLLLLHLRLSIIDLTENGWQPMASPSGRQWLVFNGEIYNYLSLREELVRAGHVFRSRSDSEVLLAALREWGAECLPRLIGMFAFAYVDLDANTALLARDPFGIKPLYWARNTDRIAFASEIPGLLALAEVERRVDPARLYAFLRFGVTDHGDGTLFSSVSQIPAGHSMHVSLAPWRVEPPRPYWVPRRLQERSVSLPQAAEQVRERFLENIRLHLQSDVPVGAALSGGIDSSAIVCGIRQVAGPGVAIHAFSFVPDDESISEERWIRLAAERSGAQLHLVRPSATEVASDLATVIRAQGEPFGSPSIYAQYRVFQAAQAQGIKVMLDGQGADELLAGYRPYLGARIAGLVRRGQWGRALGLLRAARELPGTGSLGAAMLTADVLFPPSLQAPLRRVAGRELMPDWMDATWFAERGVGAGWTKYVAGREPFWGEMERGLSVTSLPHLLRYEDRNSMAVSIESRVPFLTVPMLEDLWQLPEEFLLDDGLTSKRVFRDAMRGIVPDAILNRRDKLGFVTPTSLWMTTERKWVDDLFDFAAERAVPGIMTPNARKTWDRVGRDSRRAAGQIWRCVNYMEWVRQFGLE